MAPETSARACPRRAPREPGSAEFDLMPRAALAHVHVDHTFDLAGIAGFLQSVSP